MRISTILVAETPLYRGNARKTLFTRDGDGKQRLVSLAGEIEGTAQSLMDAFIGASRNGRNTGLLNRLWRRLYGEKLPNGLIKRVRCSLRGESYPRDRFFDLRMGIRLDEDRWAVEANANYKYETIFRNARFDFSMEVNDAMLAKGNNRAKLYYLLNEMAAGRFWFGAGKSKGLGRIRLEWEVPSEVTPPPVQPEANHLSLTLRFDARNPVLVGWNWGKTDPELPAFIPVEGRLLVEAMRTLPLPIRERLSMVLGGPILTTDDWKRKLAEFLPRVLAIHLRERSLGEQKIWTLSAAGVAKLSKGKYALSKKVIAAVKPLFDQPFDSREALQAAIEEALGEKANMAKRVVKTAKAVSRKAYALDEETWEMYRLSMGIDDALREEVEKALEDESALTEVFRGAVQHLLPRLYDQADQHIKLVQSDAWVDQELENRRVHLKIKEMLLNRQIDEAQWEDPYNPPEGISAAQWREFLQAHARVRYRHITNPRNLSKSIVNDQNFIRFLQGYRNKTRQELSQPYNTDYRAGGPSGREISQKYGKPYDTVFMRMLTLTPSREDGAAWEAYIPGSTIKGAFRKRAAQVLKTLWGENRRSREVLDALFGTQGQIGRIFFSDAYLSDPNTPDDVWCSMDGIKISPSTGQPIESAKADYLFAYGSDLVFQCRLDVQDISPEEAHLISVLAYLLEDASRGDVAVGGSKTAGFGWVKAQITDLTWLSGSAEGLTQSLFAGHTPQQEGIWQAIHLDGEQASQAVQQWKRPLSDPHTVVPSRPQRTAQGFISHRSFGGYSGMLYLTVETLTPLAVRESGAPSFYAEIEGEPVNGWDFYSLTPPHRESRPEKRQYAIPSKTLKGAIRALYTIVTDARTPSRSLQDLNPADHLFGFVGKGQNQALMGRLSFSFGLFDEPALRWYKVPYPYGEWRYTDTGWQRFPGGSAQVHRIDDTWRIFPHTPLAPIVQPQEAFAPDTVQAAYFRAIEAGSRARFSVRFWNLEEEELRRLVWALTLEEGMAHKLGNHRYLGFGSVRLRILPESYLIDWRARYAGKPESAWQQPFAAEQWLDTQLIAHRRSLREFLHVDSP